MTIYKSQQLILTPILYLLSRCDVNIVLVYWRESQKLSQDSAVHLTRTKRSEPIRPSLAAMHWLPVIF